MAEFKTPGVYVQEISTLPASIAPVATAIPAFVGYTEKREKNGETIPLNKPVRVTSLLEYKEIFGGSFDELFGVTLAGTLDNTTFTITDPGNLSPYLMYYQLKMFFTNGGGPCYIVSVGPYIDSNPGPSDIVVGNLESGVNALEEEDEPTILVVPESVHLSPTNRKTINDMLLAQCSKLQDRFAVMDAVVVSGNTVAQDATAYRAEVGSGNLKYGASYYPSLKSSQNSYYTEGSVVIADNRPTAGNGPFELCTLDIVSEGGDNAVGKIVITSITDLSGDIFNIDGTDFEADDPGGFDVGAGTASSAGNLEAAINAAGSSAYTVTRSSNVLLIQATAAGSAGETIALTYTTTGAVAATVSGSGTLQIISPDKELSNAIKAKLKKTVTLYPSATMAGIYARVDRNRGVWKAPANVSVLGITEPSVLVTAEEQDGLNVDATSGKSINAIRTFAGKGTLVWGARTLAGNDNEWRYVPVRRLYNFVEESTKKATEFVVFEPNDANTWMRLKTMIENFLSKLWRDGALAGATTEDAYFVNVGLGQTMTALDILEGRLNVEIGLAAVRPAEFIILKFSHKLQES